MEKVQNQTKNQDCTCKYTGERNCKTRMGQRQVVRSDGLEGKVGQGHNYQKAQPQLIHIHTMVYWVLEPYLQSHRSIDRA